jgi:hypothetical protein
MWMKRIAIACLALGGSLIIAAVFWIRGSQEALKSPVELRPGFSLTRTFRVPNKARYRIEIEYSRSSMPFERLHKILQGGNCFKVDLTERAAPVKMYRFSEPVFRPGIVSTDEDGNLGFAEDSISQDIGVFTGYPKKAYTITCSVIRPVDELVSTHPTLIVGLDPLEAEGRAIDSFVLFAAALLCFVLSGVLGAIFLFLRHRARRLAVVASA